MTLLHRFSFTIALAFAFTGVASPSRGQDESATAEKSVQNAAGEDSVSSSEDGESHASTAPGDDHTGSSHEAGDHDTDPTHGNMSDVAYEVVDFRSDMALFTGIVFLILLLGLYLTAWKPIMQGLEKREHQIAENISRAESAANQATEKLAEYEAKLAAAATEAQTIVMQARKDAETAGQKMIAAAQEEAASQRDRAVADIESAKRIALNELASQSTNIAMSLAQRVVGREVRADDHQGLIQEMLSKFPSNN